eukprot:Em0016g1013a
METIYQAAEQLIYKHLDLHGALHEACDTSDGKLMATLSISDAISLVEAQSTLLGQQTSLLATAHVVQGILEIVDTSIQDHAYILQPHEKETLAMWVNLALAFRSSFLLHPNHFTTCLLKATTTIYVHGTVFHMTLNMSLLICAQLKLSLAGPWTTAIGAPVDIAYRRSGGHLWDVCTVREVSLGYLREVSVREVSLGYSKGGVSWLLMDAEGRVGILLDYLMSSVLALSRHQGREAEEVVIDTIHTMVSMAISDMEPHTLYCALVLARHCGQEGSHLFPSYKDWFQQTFADPQSGLLTPKRSLQFFMRCLRDVVPFEPSECLKVHMSCLMKCVPNSHSTVEEYRVLARTRLDDLQEHDPSTEMSSVSTATPPSSHELKSALMDVREAMEDFRKNELDGDEVQLTSPLVGSLKQLVEAVKQGEVTPGLSALSVAMEMQIQGHQQSRKEDSLSSPVHVQLDLSFPGLFQWEVQASKDSGYVVLLPCHLYGFDHCSYVDKGDEYHVLIWQLAALSSASLYHPMCSSHLQLLGLIDGRNSVMVQPEDSEKSVITLDVFGVWTPVWKLQYLSSKYSFLEDNLTQEGGASIHDIQRFGGDIGDAFCRLFAALAKTCMPIPCSCVCSREGGPGDWSNGVQLLQGKEALFRSSYHCKLLAQAQLRSQFVHTCPLFGASVLAHWSHIRGAFQLTAAMSIPEILVEVESLSQWVQSSLRLPVPHFDCSEWPLAIGACLFHHIRTSSEAGVDELCAQLKAKLPSLSGKVLCTLLWCSLRDACVNLCTLLSGLEEAVPLSSWDPLVVSVGCITADPSTVIMFEGVLSDSVTSGLLADMRRHFQPCQVPCLTAILFMVLSRVSADIFKQLTLQPAFLKLCVTAHRLFLQGIESTWPVSERNGRSDSLVSPHISVSFIEMCRAQTVTAIQQSPPHMAQGCLEHCHDAVKPYCVAQMVRSSL